MAREIVVPAAPSRLYSKVVPYSIMSAFALGIASTLANNGAFRSVGIQEWNSLSATLNSAVVTLLSLIAVASLSKRTPAVIVVQVYPLGIQLCTRTGSGHVERVQFIPRDLIFDCIVMESIRATKVTSVVMFRIQSHNSDLTLQEAFRGGSEMSYTSCLALRAQVMKALEETTGKKPG
jgi:hypothetical protein